MSRLPQKDPAEIKLLSFEFSGDVAPGDTITAVELTIAGPAGSDPGVALAMLDGAAVIDNNRYSVHQRVRGGLSAIDYELRCLATDSAGQKHLVAATLPVRTLH